MRPIFYDTETTGVQHKRDKVIEIAFYDPTNDTSYEKLINPGIPIPPDATRIHGISDEMVKDAPTFDQIIDEMEAFCSGEVVLIAHNNDSFDIHFLKAEWSRSDRELPSSWLFFDTLKWARKYRPDLPRHSLQYLRELYGFPPNNAHRALDDVITLHRVYEKMVDDLDIKTAFDLIYNSDQPSDKVTTMPFGKHKGVCLSKLPSSYVAWLKKSEVFEKPENAPLLEGLKACGKL